MSKRTYIDSGVLIAAVRGDDNIARAAFDVLDDPQRVMVASEAVRLEVLPKAYYERQQEASNFYEEFFRNSEIFPWNVDSLKKAYHIAENYGTAAMDAIHVAHAIDGKVDELITTEKPSKPIFRVKEITIHSIARENST